MKFASPAEGRSIGAAKDIAGSEKQRYELPNMSGNIRISRRAEPMPKNTEGQLSVDIYQTEDKMLIICPIAGVEKTEIKVAIQDDVLTIRGERKRLPIMEGKMPLVKELFWGVFSRSIVLPDHIDRKNIKAKVNDSLLTITIPKTEDFKTRIIHINDEE